MHASRPVLSVLLWTVLSLFTLFPIYWLFVISVKGKLLGQKFAEEYDVVQ